MTFKEYCFALKLDFGLDNLRFDFNRRGVSNIIIVFLAMYFFYFKLIGSNDGFSFILSLCIPFVCLNCAKTYSRFTLRPTVISTYPLTPKRTVTYDYILATCKILIFALLLLIVSVLNSLIVGGFHNLMSAIKNMVFSESNNYGNIFSFNEILLIMFIIMPAAYLYNNKKQGAYLLFTVIFIAVYDLFVKSCLSAQTPFGSISRNFTRNKNNLTVLLVSIAITIFLSICSYRRAVSNAEKSFENSENQTNET